MLVPLYSKSAIGLILVSFGKYTLNSVGSFPCKSLSCPMVSYSWCHQTCWKWSYIDTFGSLEGLSLVCKAFESLFHDSPYHAPWRLLGFPVRYYKGITTEAYRISIDWKNSLASLVIFLPFKLDVQMLKLCVILWLSANDMLIPLPHYSFVSWGCHIYCCDLPIFLIFLFWFGLSFCSQDSLVPESFSILCHVQVWSELYIVYNWHSFIYKLRMV